MNIMINSGYIVRVPGKLMIAGEYAVLEPGHQAVVAAVDRYVTAHIIPSCQNKLSLPQLSMENITWEIGEGKVQFNISDSRLGFIQNSIAVSSQYLNESLVKLCPFHLKIVSGLDDPETGKKYGLGSSAAVVAAVIFAVLYFHAVGIEPDDLEKVFKLSALAHLKTQRGGSGADIAAAIYGGWLQYSAFSAEWVLKQEKKGVGLKQLLGRSWPYLSIKQVVPPTQLKLAVGWTGKPAATIPMIENLKTLRKNNYEVYKEFLKESDEAVEKLIKGFEFNDCKEAINSLRLNRKALIKLQHKTEINIETEELGTLCYIAEAFGSGKSSGAGGGDCGIAFLKDDDSRQELYKEWKAAGIEPLELRVAQKGVTIEKNNK
jgi:phosphomevalonate kinase, ERG8-type, Gram-positive branch